jgi:hypothetical protein
MSITVGDNVKVVEPFSEWFNDLSYPVVAVSDDGQCISILAADIVRDFDPVYLEVV